MMYLQTTNNIILKDFKHYGYLRDVSLESRLPVFMVMPSLKNMSLAGEARASLWDRDGWMRWCCSLLRVV